VKSELTDNLSFSTGGTKPYLASGQLSGQNLASVSSAVGVLVLVVVLQRHRLQQLTQQHL
jgi:hypothetical protein